MNIAIITGASSGIGEQILRMLVLENEQFGSPFYDQFWVIARNADRLERIREELAPSSIRVFALDLSDPDSMNLLSNTLENEKPSVHLLVNCAGIGRTGRFDAQTPEDQRAMVLINCAVPAQLCSICLPYMKCTSKKSEAGRGLRIMNIASSAGFLPQPGFVTYAASKTFLIHFSRALSAELKGTNIRCTVVCPGPVSTDFLIHATGNPNASFSGIKRLFVARPDQLAAKAIRATQKGRPLFVYGLSQKFLHLVSKILPTRTILFLTGLLSKPDGS